MKEIFVTEPFLPPLDEYTKYLKEIWKTKQLTNMGEYHKKFELALSKYLNVEHVSLVNSATTGLIIAQRALGFSGEIITTPFSFIATAHTIKWNEFKPRFVDTDRYSGNLDPRQVEAAISQNTGGILAVFNYGIPENIECLQKISRKNKIPLLYDAAPALGVKYKGKSILKNGDAAVISFHGTKIFTTMEGGAIISKSSKIKKKVDRLKNFSILDYETVSGIGTNGKMNELQAAMGLLQLKYLDQSIKKRKLVYKKYCKHLNEINGISLLKIPNEIDYNYSYMPLFFDAGKTYRDKIFLEMKKNNIICRKYWYPLITDHEVYNQGQNTKFPNARRLSDSVLCLPIYPALSSKHIFRIIKIFKKV